MRPEGNEKPQELYECPGCGQRTSDTESRLCGACGCEMINLAKSRDL